MPKYTRTKVNFQALAAGALEKFGFITAQDMHNALGLPHLTLTQDALRQAVLRLRKAGWKIDTRPRHQGGGYELNVADDRYTYRR